MKTALNQILTVVGVFTMALTTTLVISWGMTDYLGSTFQDNNKDNIIQKEISIEYKINFLKAFKLLIPKVSNTRKG